MTRAATFALLLFAATARADTLGDLRAALQTLHGEAPIRATYDVQTQRTGDEAMNTAANVDVRIDSDGLTITFPRPLVDKLVAQPPRGEGKSDGVRAANVSPSNVTQLLNYGPALLRRIEKATVIRELPSTYQGQPVRTLVLNVPQSGRVPKMLKVDTTETMTLILGADHLPMTLESSGKFSAGILFLKAEGTQKESIVFLRHDDRLIVAKRQQESKTSGLGESSQGHETESVVTK